MSTALIIRDDSNRVIQFTPQAEAARQEAVDLAALIGCVNNPVQQAAAVEVMGKLKALEIETEKARKAATEPVLEFQRLIMSTAREFLKPVVAEITRVATMLGNYQTLEEQKRRAAEFAQRQEQDRLERERQAALAKVQSHDEADRVQEHFNQRAAEIPTPPPPPRAEGQIVREDWEVTVQDVWALARAHPMCVTVTPRLSEIKALLDAGIKVAGVKAERKIKSTVRAARGPLVLENT